MSAESPALPARATVTARAEPRPALRSAGRIVAVGAALGVLGQLLFFGVGLGLNVPMAVAAILFAAWRLRDEDRPLHPTDAWLPAAAIAFAVFVALRGDPTLIALDLLATALLTGASLAAIGGTAVFSRPLRPLAGLAMRLGGWSVGAAGWALADARASLPPASGLRRRVGTAAPVLRGLAIGLPLVLVFAVLFSAADAVFARMLGDLFGLDLDLGELTGRLLLGIALGWFAMGAVAFSAAAPPNEVTPASDWRRLGTVEAITVLLVVDAVFALFVALQAAYLFGGLDTLQAAGLTYAEYARRGFFELIAVSLLAGGLVLALETFVVGRSRTYVAAAIGLAALTAVVLASATLRLRLYQDAYGWTELRFYALAAIAWLAIGVVVAIAALATDRSRWLPRGLLIGAVVVGLAVNLVGPVRYLAEQNVARALNPELVPDHGATGLDFQYLLGLGTDAVGPLAQALPSLEGAVRDDVGYVLDQHRSDLLRAGRDDWQEWNLSRALARDALE